MTRRGLTLLEVVLAVALLALAAGGVASAVSAIVQPADRIPPNPGMLAATVDEVLRNPERHEFDAIEVTSSGRGVLRVDGVAIEVTLKARSGRGAWLEFSRRDQQIARWVRVPEPRP
ncbi:MAG: prepilin-type N-terminal cleavage/methylation domain-containing protein [Phycisphaerales bacterium]|nr:prepilin-type N-terminal cleavage/methylation domain-containing protein [Phycisphaerales bacterium]